MKESKVNTTVLLYSPCSCAPIMESIALHPPSITTAHLRRMNSLSATHKLRQPNSRFAPFQPLYKTHKEFTETSTKLTFCSATHGRGVCNLGIYIHGNKRKIILYQPKAGILDRNYVKMYVNKAEIRPLHSGQGFRGTLLDCRAERIDTHNDGGEEEEKGENISKATLIWRAIKLPMYTVALVPITVGSAAAYLQTGQFIGKRYFMLMISSVLVIAWLNLSNDVYDFDAGADKNKKESVVNLFGSRTGTHFFAWLLLALGLMGITWVAVQAGSPRSLVLIAYAIICGCLYQCPPFRFSYLGLGEPLCFAAFGPFATIAFHLIQSGTRELSISGTVVSSSILVGLTTSLILFCSHFHQIEDDKAVGKYSPLVRLGSKNGAGVVKTAVVALYFLLFILGLGQTLPFASVVLCAMTLPIGRMVVDFVGKNHNDKTKIFMAKYYCVRLHAVFGTALAAGLVAARMFARKKLPHAIILS